MKKIAIMQPYFFPYLGYFQLINAVDLFVFYDDVNFITRGWIHRNRVLVNNKASYLTVPCKKASQNKLIHEIETALDDKKRRKLINKIKFSYGNAPYFEQVFPLIKKVLNAKTETIAELAIKSVLKCTEYLHLETSFKISSECYENREMDKAERLIDITKKESGETYINAIGGKELYDKKNFAEQDIDLKFLHSEPPVYNQFEGDFIPGLSIIDVMMFNSVEEIHQQLEQYTLE
jgi:hypothetical protein